MPLFGKEETGRSRLHYLPCVHDRNPRGHLADDAHVMRYEQKPGIAFDKAAQQREDLRLRGHV